MKVLIDMNLSPRWVGRLRTAGFEAVHWSTIGNPNALDTEIMDFARSNDFVVLTSDLDFSAILAATGGTKPSVAQIRSPNLDANRLEGYVVAALLQSIDALENGALIMIDADKARIRLLPL
jgi:predicted nuclease of predicted toxin-antitoxin system